MCVSRLELKGVREPYRLRVSTLNQAAEVSGETFKILCKSIVTRRDSKQKNYNLLQVAFMSYEIYIDKTQDFLYMEFAL